jgi:non-canonical poly(A) RNA polymerase PAPD5/7
VRTYPPLIFVYVETGFPANDVSRGTYAIAKVRATFAGAFGILTSAAFSRVGLIKARRDGSYTNLRKRAELGEMSILSSVLGITQEVKSQSLSCLDVY